MTQRSGLKASRVSAPISSSVNMTVLSFAAAFELLCQGIKLLLQYRVLAHQASRIAKRLELVHVATQWLGQCVDVLLRRLP